MVLPDFTELDQDEISRNSFFPRENVAPIPDGAELHNIDVGNKMVFNNLNRKWRG